MKPSTPKKITRNMAKEQPNMKPGKPVDNKKTLYNFNKPAPKAQPNAKGLSIKKS